MSAAFTPLASGFYALPWSARVRALGDTGRLDNDDVHALLPGASLLDVAAADRMVENVVGVMGLPLAVATGMVVDGVSFVTPMVVEEPSIVAAQSAAAKLIAGAGGFVTCLKESLLMGQIELVGLADSEQAQRRLLQAKAELLSLARQLQPGMVARGGGAQDITVQLAGDGPNGSLVLQLWVDTCDAMGANAVNSLCESLAPKVAQLASDGRPGLRILSNLCDRSVVTARCVVPWQQLAYKNLHGKEVRDLIVQASRLAEHDVHRAATHNKGIMNGVDAVALATGNDWRAIEAGAHAWAGRGSGYRPLSGWQVQNDGALVGDICLPIKVGIVGGNFLANPSVALALRLLRVPSAKILARLMAAVGLAQNFAALRALATVGIQSGHMALHARSVVASAGAKQQHFERAVHMLLQGGDIKLHRARAIVEQLDAEAAANTTSEKNPEAAGLWAWAHGSGKLIVLGEHAVVYRSHALAVPLSLATKVGIGPQATAPAVGDAKPPVHLRIDAWGIDTLLHAQGPSARLHERLFASIKLIIESLNLCDRAFCMVVDPQVPRAMGLGSSAALAVATVRALSAYFKLNLSPQRVIDVAFEAEKLAHGTPSGVDNALATLGMPLIFQRGDAAPKIIRQKILGELHWVVGLTHQESLTATTVAQVARAHQSCPSHFDRIFAHIDALTLAASEAMATGDKVLLGRLMNINHGLLHALRVSTPQLEALIDVAHREGALGAKVTGGGGGGSMLTLCADEAMQKRVQQAFVAAGFRALLATSKEVCS